MHKLKTITTLLVTLILTCSSVSADQEKAESDLFTARTPEKFTEALKSATNAEIHKQVILEATFLYYVDTENYKGIVNIRKKFQAYLNEFNLDHSKIFATKEQWESVIQYGLALEALHKNQESVFKKHITEAYWLSPETASAYSHHITQARNKKYITTVQINPEQEMLTLETQTPITFKKMIGDNDAIVLRFWSPWNQQMDKSYPFIISSAEQCSQNKIAFASVLTGNDQALIESALEIITTSKPTLNSQWLTDSNSKAFTKLLRISNLPTMIIITKDGKVHHHGSASNSSFWQTLKSIKPKIKIPTFSE